MRSHDFLHKSNARQNREKKSNSSPKWCWFYSIIEQKNRRQIEKEMINRIQNRLSILQLVDLQVNQFFLFSSCVEWVQNLIKTNFHWLGLTKISWQLQSNNSYKKGKSINTSPLIRIQNNNKADPTTKKERKKWIKNNSNFGQTTNRYTRLCAVLRCGIVTLDHDRLLSMGKNLFPRIQVIVLN